MLKRLSKILIVLGLIAALAAGGFTFRVWSGLSKAESMSQYELWGQARYELENYLKLFPNDEKAHMLMAECLIRDDRLQREDAIEQALLHLHEVPDNCEFGALARTKEARCEFLLMLRPSRAERSLLRALKQDPQSQEANSMLWKLYDYSGRSHLAEQAFWNLYYGSAEDEKLKLLKDWYLSQFSTVAIHADLNERMGMEGRSDDDFYAVYIEREPDGYLGYVCLAFRAIGLGRPEEALATLDEAEELVGEDVGTSYFVDCRISGLIELGEFEKAGEYFKQWPEENRGFEYWVSRAILADELEDDLPKAIESFEKALSIWPGPADWRVRNLLASCLARTGKIEEARKHRKQAEGISDLLSMEAQHKMRTALEQLQDPASLQVVIDFYDALGRAREVECWREHLERIRGNSGIDPVETGSLLDGNTVSR